MPTTRNRSSRSLHALALNERRIEPQSLRLYEVDAVFESVDPALPFVKLEPRQTYPFFIHNVCLF